MGAPALGFEFSALRMEGAPPARQRALNTRDGLVAVGVGTLVFRLMATTQPVEGAALIRR